MTPLPDPPDRTDPTDETDDDPKIENKARVETLAIPGWLREQVDDRDKQRCRVCGKYLAEARALHHIRFGGARQGMGGRRDHSLDNLITVCWMWAGNCHDRVHSQKRLYLPVLEQLTVTPGVTGMQLMRWEAAQQRPQMRVRRADTQP
jgi:hypothetical protein